MKGKSARFRARRMRLLITMSDSGPEPRSHSPLVRANSSSSTLIQPFRIAALARADWCQFRPDSFLGGPFNAADFVPQLRGPFVIFFLNGRLQVPAESDHLGPLVAVGGHARRVL